LRRKGVLKPTKLPPSIQPSSRVTRARAQASDNSLTPEGSGKRASGSSVRSKAPKSSGVTGSSSRKRKTREVETSSESEPPTEERLPSLPEQQNEQQIEHQITEPNTDIMSQPGASAQGQNINPNLNPVGGNPPAGNQNPPAPGQQGPTLERKYPNPWDVSRPKFSRVPDVGEIKTFWDHIDGIWATRPVVTDDVKKARTLEFVDAIDLKDQWKGIAEYGPNYTYEQWKTAILTFYPEIEELVSGSIFKMQGLCKNAKGLERKDLGPFRRFAMAFNTEALKLLSPPALVTNRDLVQVVLDTLAADFAKEVELTLNQPSSAAVIVQNSELKLAPPSPVVQQAMQAQLNRRGDKFTYIQVLHVVDYLMCNWSGRSAMDSLNLGGGVDNGVLAGKSLLPGAVNPLLPTDGQLVDTLLGGKSIKHEVSDKLDLFAQEIAGMKDTINLQDKRINESVKKMSDTIENSFKVLNQSLKSPAPREAPRVENREYRPSEGTRKGPCFFCFGPHMISECEVKEEFIRIGWVVVKDGKMTMGDGTYIPRFPEDISRAEKIEKYHNNKGMTRESPAPKKSAMMNTYMGQYDDHGSFDRVDHIYDSRDDELRSYRAQQNMLANRGSTYQMPVRQPIVQQSVEQPVANMNYSILQRPVQQQMQPSAESSAMVPGMDIQQLIQFIDTVRGPNNASREPSGEQFVQTRTGARTDSNPSQGF
jgi:hypothetical protein